MTAGLYHSAQSVSDDTCLYLENFAFRVANSSHLDAKTKAQVTQGFEYYLGLDGNTTAEQIAGEVRGLGLGLGLGSGRRCRPVAHLSDTGFADVTQGLRSRLSCPTSGLIKVSSAACRLL